MAAGFGGSDVPPSQPGDATGTSGNNNPDGDHGEMAWRLRHARRGVLKDLTIPEDVLDAGAPDTGGFDPSSIFGPAQSSSRFASSFFASSPLSGQVDFLTTTSFETPQQLFSADSFGRGVAYVSVGAPLGDHADWNVRGAMTQGDISSWIVAGEYVTRSPARHRYDLGMSYAAQRYDAGSLAAFYDASDGTRSAGTVYGFDTFTITPSIALTYGARYSRYDYLSTGNLVSPHVALTLTPSPHVRINGLVSSRATAPGAEEFLPPGDSGIFLPPQRTFSPLNPGDPMRPERTTHAEVEVEHDIAGSTIAVRAFHQHVADQLLTMFGVDMPDQPNADAGHYFVGNTGAVNATGWSARFRTAIAERVHGTIEYSRATAMWVPGGDVAYLVLLAPSALRLESQHLNNVTTTLETEVPETSTKVMVLCRVSNAFARLASPDGPNGGTPVADARFDVQVRQALPFMDFSSARWEMLIAVRNMFRESAVDQSVYDELHVVRPPKRIVGGLTLHF
jgi:hypothetical protein